MNRSLMYGFALALLVATAPVACMDASKGKAEEPRRTYNVTRQDLVSVVSATGEVAPAFEVEVKSKASGEILEFKFDPGDYVRKGDVLITLDRKTEQRNLARNQAELARIKADLESAKADLTMKNSDLKRTRQLFDKKLVSGRDLDLAVAGEAMARARVDEIKASISRARLSVEDARERLEETTITAPIDGVITQKNVERGQIISSGISSVTGGTSLCVIADLSRLFIYALVDETDIGKVKEGGKVNVSVDAYPEMTFGGVVKRVYPQGETSDNITVFRVKIEALDAEKSFLKPKMTANVDIVIEKHENVLSVPDEAIVYAEHGKDQAHVYLVVNGKTVKTPVKPGLSNGFETEITEGLSDGDVVMLNPPRKDDRGQESS